MGVEYEDKCRCPKCGNFNNVEVKDMVNADVCEADTKCQKCGHVDFWSHGFYKSPESKSDLKPELSFYHLVLMGNNGVEYYKVFQDKADLKPELLNTMELRARMNGHREIAGWGFAFPSEIHADKITHQLLKMVKAVKLF